MIEVFINNRYEQQVEMPTNISKQECQLNSITTPWLLRNLDISFKCALNNWTDNQFLASFNILE